MVALEGKETIKDKELKFLAAFGNSYLQNTATISKDGKTLEGETTAIIYNEKGISYKWKAIKRK